LTQEIEKYKIVPTTISPLLISSSPHNQPINLSINKKKPRGGNKLYKEAVRYDMHKCQKQHPSKLTRGIMKQRKGN